MDDMKEGTELVEQPAGGTEQLSGKDAFFQAAENGDVATLKVLLANRNELGFDVNDRNESGYTAMQIAIMEGYVVILNELLLIDAHVGDALLRAAETEFEHAVKCILDYATKKPEEDRDRIINCHCEGSDFHPLLTPIMRAAQKNNYSIVKRLLDVGARIPESKFDDGGGSGAGTIDSLLQSIGLVEKYSALATPAYVTQAYSDPIDKAFQLSKTLEKISYVEVEHKLVFQEMGRKMEQLAADLIAEARNTDEILTILKYSEKAPDRAKKKTASTTVLPKISRAIKYKQKRFVAEPNCQQATSTQFRRQLVDIGDWSAFMQLLLLLGVILCYPLLSILYKMGVKGSFRKFIRTPYVKFMMQLGSDIALLAIITAKTFIDGPQDISLEIFEIGLLVAFALGIAYKTLSYLVVDGPKFFFNFTHYRDLLIVSLLMFECILEALKVYEIQMEAEIKPFVEREQNEVAVLSKPILALVSVLAFLRILPYLTANDLVGAFQISLGDMIVNTSHFYVILVGVFVAFSSGMTFIYSNTVQGSRELSCEFRRGDCSDLKVHFNSIVDATITLFWSLFGLIGIDILNLPANQQVQQIAGVVMYVLFHLLAVLVLLNALIAVMSNVYNAVEENADVEWKYSRTALWMSFMDDMFTVPPPFNLLPDMGDFFHHCTLCCNTKNGNDTEIQHTEDDQREYRSVHYDDYQRVIKQLMERYVARRLTDEQSATGGIGPMDIRDLRNDVAALRFDVTAKLLQMEESIDRGKDQSVVIYGQSEETHNVFDKTLEIDGMVSKYRFGINERCNDVKKYKEFIPAFGQVDALMGELVRALEETIKTTATVSTSTNPRNPATSTGTSTDASYPTSSAGTLTDPRHFTAYASTSTTSIKSTASTSTQTDLYVHPSPAPISSSRIVSSLIRQYETPKTTQETGLDLLQRGSHGYGMRQSRSTSGLSEASRVHVPQGAGSRSASSSRSNLQGGLDDPDEPFHQK
ncbi:short transient receptor potential channel 4-like [Lytechinus pictus]|uniref:short transient receptor potential channel 4-like n=1 Tax=Lytechinus pictus TaxID=7653 RepID=UPI0030BA2792